MLLKEIINKVPWWVVALALMAGLYIYYDLEVRKIDSVERIEFAKIQKAEAVKTNNIVEYRTVVERIEDTSTITKANEVMK